MSARAGSQLAGLVVPMVSLVARDVVRDGAHGEGYLGVVMGPAARVGAVDGDHAPPPPVIVCVSRSNSISMVAPTRGSRVVPYRVPLADLRNMIEGHGPPLSWSTMLFPFVTTRPGQLEDFAMLFVPTDDRVHFAMNVESSLICSVQSASSSQ